MDPRYREWLQISLPDRRSAETRLSHLRRVESAYGDIDALYDLDGLQGLIAELSYTTEDKRFNRPNPSKILFDGDIYNNLASYKAAVQKYSRFREDVFSETAPASHDKSSSVSFERDVGERESVFTLERDLQSSLRKSLGQLETGLSVADGGVERMVASGRIDIFAKDGSGNAVVVELKAVRALRDAVAQVQSYMGDILDETGGPVRGFLVAPEFDPRALAAAKIVPTLTLVTYGFNFTFKKLD